MARVMLERDGMEVVEAPDGATALDRVRHAEPDAILLDVDLGEESGRELLRVMRAEPDIPAVPVIYCTGKARDPGGDDLASDPGVVGVVPKPFDPGTLAATVRTLLHRGTAADG